jgi:hypothetical protein
MYRTFSMQPASVEWLNLQAISVGTPEVQAGYVRCATGQLLLQDGERR